jgi:hypothetical protein
MVVKSGCGEFSSLFSNACLLLTEPLSEITEDRSGGGVTDNEPLEGKGPALPPKIASVAGSWVIFSSWTESSNAPVRFLWT